MTAEEIYKLVAPFWAKWPGTRPEGFWFDSLNWMTRNDDFIPANLAELIVEAAVVRWLGKRCGVLVRGPTDHDKRWIVTLTGEADEHWGPTLLHALVAAAMQVPKDAAPDAPQ